jgi:proline iminopeptidase
MKSSEGFAFVRPGLHLYYRVLGEEGSPADTVVAPNASWLWEPLQPLAEGRRLILYDPRSRGRSSAVTEPRQLGLEADVADLEAIRRWFGLDRMTLLGSSYHAAITALYALENPERVERMLLVCPITPRRPGEWVQELPTSELLIHPPGMPRLDELRREGVEEEDPAAYCRAWFTHFLLPAQMGDATAIARFPVADVCSFPNEWPRHAIPLYFEHIIPGMGQWDFLPRLQELRCPVLVMQGTEDLVPLEASRDWAEALPDARFLRLEGVGHHPYLESPKEFFPAAEAFLRGGWPEGAETVGPALRS